MITHTDTPRTEATDRTASSTIRGHTLAIDPPPIRVPLPTIDPPGLVRDGRTLEAPALKPQATTEPEDHDG